MRLVRTETPFLVDRALHHLNHLVDRLVEVERLASWRRLLDVIAHATDDILRSIGIPDNAGERLHDFGRFGGLISKKRMPARALLRAVAIG